MPSKEEIKQWLLGNCVNEMGNLDLSDLDFSDFDGDVYIGKMRVKKDLRQYGQQVGGNLSQQLQEVGGILSQGDQRVKGDLHQAGQKVGGSLSQQCQEVEGDLYQGARKVKGDVHNLYSKRFEDDGLLYALNECKSLIDSNLELLRAKAKAEADFKHDAMYAEFESECSYREARAAAFDEAVEMAKQTAGAIARWIEFAKGKEQKQ